MEGESTFDLSGVQEVFTSGTAAIATLGGLALAMAVGVKVWKRLRGAA